MVDVLVGSKAVTMAVKKAEPMVDEKVLMTVALKDCLLADMMVVW